MPLEDLEDQPMTPDTPTAIAQEYVELRCSAHPWMLVTSPDPEGAIARMAAIEAATPQLNGVTLAWNLAAGHRLLAGDAAVSQSLGETANKPFPLLVGAQRLPEKAVLFLLVPSAQFWSSDICVSAILNLREPFKATSRTLVLVCTPEAGDRLPPQLAEDVPVLNEALPSEGELRAMASRLVEDNAVRCEDQALDRAVSNLRGMTSFAAENALARKCLTGTLLARELADVRRQSIEDSTGGALVFERETLTFSDVGGLGALRSYMERLFAGPDAPDLIVRIDEIDKVVSAAATGAVADNTGVSQDMLRTLLTAIEDNGWLFLLLSGVPGSGKTLSTIATGNTFGRTTLAADFGRCRGSLVGQSEAAVRRMIDVIRALGGRKVLLCATANRMDTLPPELLSRAGAGGIWFFDVPDLDERQAIWRIQRACFDINPGDLTPDDELWVGRDIRNCCRTARMLGLPLREAADYTMITGVVSQELVAQSRYLAATSGYLSVCRRGRYVPPGTIDLSELKTVAAGGRKIVPVSGGSTGEA